MIAIGRPYVRTSTLTQVQIPSMLRRKIGWNIKLLTVLLLKQKIYTATFASQAAPLINQLNSVISDIEQIFGLERNDVKAF